MPCRFRPDLLVRLDHAERLLGELEERSGNRLLLREHRALLRALRAAAERSGATDQPCDEPRGLGGSEGP